MPHPDFTHLPAPVASDLYDVVVKGEVITSANDLQTATSYARELCTVYKRSAIRSRFGVINFKG